MFGMPLNTKTCIVFAAVFNSAVIGVLQSEESRDLQNTQVKIDEVQRLRNCRTSQEYLNLSHFGLNTRNIPVVDTACLALRMFREMGFIQDFNISVDTLCRFILRAQDGYHSEILYHNWSHGFAVLHFSFAVLKNCRLIEKDHVTPLEGLALLTAAMCHDIDHPGTNNQFQTELNNSLTQKYREQGSILERHHIAVTLKLLTTPETNFVAHFDEHKLTDFKNLITQIILATDLSVHFKLLPDEQKMAATGFDKLNKQHRELLRSVIISCADLSDQTKDWATVRFVVKLLFSEFFAQGDRERLMGLVPTKMMDRNQAKISQLQVDFLNQVIVPGFQVLLLLYPETKDCMDNIRQNLVYWQKSIPYFENQLDHGRQQMGILNDKTLDYITNWSSEE